MHYKFKNYLSEEDPLRVIKENITSQKKIIVESPTGSGKTYAFIKIGKEREGKTIFLVPNVSNVQQISEEYQIPGVFGTEVREGIWQESNVVVATYDKAASFIKENLSDLLVVLDEAHNLQVQANFRSNAILGVKNLVKHAKEVVYLSATINHLCYDLYGKVIKFEHEKSRSIIKASKILISGKNPNKEVALDLIKKKIVEGKRCLVKMNNKKSLTYIQEKLKKIDITSDLLTAENKKDSEVMLKIVKDQELSENYQVILCTSLLDAGVNLKKVDVIIDVENGDPNAIKQLSARPRKSLGEHYVIVGGAKKLKKGKEKETSYTKELVEQGIQRRIITARNIMDDLKNYVTNLKDETKNFLMYKFSLIEDSLDKEYFVKMKDPNSFYIDIEAIRNVEYEKYYNSLQNNPELLKKELEEYGLTPVIEEYTMNSKKDSSLFKYGEESSVNVEEKLSSYLKKLQSKEAQQVALEYYQDPYFEKYFETTKFWKELHVPFEVFHTFGMYMTLGFQYRLTYELMMKTYRSPQKRNKIKNYMQAYVYSKLKDDPSVLKDNKGYKAFKILFDLYSVDVNEEISKESEEKALLEYSYLLGKSYSKNHLSKRGRELADLEDKSSKKNGITTHFKVSKGLHNAESILKSFGIIEVQYIQEFQELLNRKVECKLIDLYEDKIDETLRPEGMTIKTAQETYRVEYSMGFILTKENQNTKANFLNNAASLPSPYFEKENFLAEIKRVTDENVDFPKKSRLINTKPIVITTEALEEESNHLKESDLEFDIENPFD